MMSDSLLYSGGDAAMMSVGTSMALAPECGLTFPQKCTYVSQFFTNAQVWQNRQLCIPINLQFPSIFTSCVFSKCKLGCQEQYILIL